MGSCQHFCHFSSPYVITVPSPQIALNMGNSPAVANAPSMVNTPSVAFKPTMYSANPVAIPAANPEPNFFNFGGGYGRRGWLGSNNMGGKVLIK